MFRKWISLVGAVCMVMAIRLPVQGQELGMLRIMPRWGGNVIPGGTVCLSRVGERTGGGFCVTDGLADWIVSEEEIFSGDWTAWLENQAHNTMIRTVEQGSGACFEELPEGLYLVRQSDAAPEFMAFRPFLLSIPEGTQWDVVREVSLIRNGEAPQTGDRHVPLIGAMGIGFSVAVLMILADQRKK